MGTIDQQRRQQHVAWIQAHQEKIAAAGYGGFRQHGAGALLIDLDQFQGRAEDEQVFIEAAFAGRASILQFLRATFGQNDPIVGEVKRLISQYEPSQEVVVILTEDKEGVHAYQIRCQPTPAECWRAARASDN